MTEPVPCKKCGGSLFIQMDCLWDTGLEKGEPFCATCAGLIPKNTKTEDDSVPCVGCGKPSQRQTPDDADMCHECFGDFNATEYSNLKKMTIQLIKALQWAKPYVARLRDTEKIDRALADFEKDFSIEEDGDELDIPAFLRRQQEKI